MLVSILINAFFASRSALVAAAAQDSLGKCHIRAVPDCCWPYKGHTQPLNEIPGLAGSYDIEHTYEVYGESIVPHDPIGTGTYDRSSDIYIFRNAHVRVGQPADWHVGIDGDKNIPALKDFHMSTKAGSYSYDYFAGQENEFGGKIDGVLGMPNPLQMWNPITQEWYTSTNDGTSNRLQLLVGGKPVHGVDNMYRNAGVNNSESVQFDYSGFKLTERVHTENGDTLWYGTGRIKVEKGYLKIPDYNCTVSIEKEYQLKENAATLTSTVNIGVVQGTCPDVVLSFIAGDIGIGPRTGFSDYQIAEHGTCSRYRGFIDGRVIVPFGPYDNETIQDYSVAAKFFFGDMSERDGEKEVSYFHGAITPDHRECDFNTLPENVVFFEGSEHQFIINGTRFGFVFGTEMDASFLGSDHDACMMLSVKDDPHVLHADGGACDVRGEDGATYNLISHSHIAVNALFEHVDYRTKERLVHGSYMREMYITARTNTSNELHVEYLAKKPLSAAVTTGESVKDIHEELLPLDNIAISHTGRTLKVQTPDWVILAKSKVNPTIVGASTCATGRCFLSISISPRFEAGTLKVAPHGLVGQSYDGDGVGVFGKVDDYQGKEFTTSANCEGAIEGEASDYKMKSKFGTDFPFSRYGKESAPSRNISSLSGIKMNQVHGINLDME